MGGQLIIWKDEDFWAFHYSVHTKKIFLNHQVNHTRYFKKNYLKYKESQRRKRKNDIDRQGKEKKISKTLLKTY